MSNICPACGYALDFAPWVGDLPSDEICPCCGIQFGYDDAMGGDPGDRDIFYRRWRTNWISGGSLWFSKSRRAPVGWNPVEQLERVQTPR